MTEENGLDLEETIDSPNPEDVVDSIETAVQTIQEEADSIETIVEESIESVSTDAEEAVETETDNAEASEDIEAKEETEEESHEKRKTLLASLEGVLSDEFKGGKAETSTDEKEEKKPAFELPPEFQTEEKTEEPEPVKEDYDKEPPVILFDSVHKEYEGQVKDSVALKEVSFAINKGEFVFIVGPSGSGKSTMIRLMMREILPSQGKIYIAGKDLSKLRRRHISKYRRNIGIVFQNFRLLPDRNVYDNVAFAQRVIGAHKRDIPKEVSKVLHLVGLADKYKSFPNELSGGEQQRVAIARALINNPMIILADEPTGNLDPENSYEIMSLLEEINRRGTTVVVVTHNREIVDQMQKRVVMLQNGLIVEDKKGGYGRG